MWKKKNRFCRRYNNNIVTFIGNTLKYSTECNRDGIFLLHKIIINKKHTEFGTFDTLMLCLKLKKILYV